MGKCPSRFDIINGYNSVDGEEEDSSDRPPSRIPLMNERERSSLPGEFGMRNPAVGWRGSQCQWVFLLYWVVGFAGGAFVSFAV